LQGPKTCIKKKQSAEPHIHEIKDSHKPGVMKVAQKVLLVQFEGPELSSQDLKYNVLFFLSSAQQTAGLQEFCMNLDIYNSEL